MQPVNGTLTQGLSTVNTMQATVTTRTTVIHATPDSKLATYSAKRGHWHQTATPLLGRPQLARPDQLVEHRPTQSKRRCRFFHSIEHGWNIGQLCSPAHVQYTFPPSPKIGSSAAGRFLITPGTAKSATGWSPVHLNRPERTVFRNRRWDLWTCAERPRVSRCTPRQTDLGFRSERP
jgi:hypothetical protein